MTIRGEYWYSSNDKLYSCDGDRNKFGHEGFVINYCRKLLTAEIEKKIKKKDDWGDPIKIELKDKWGLGMDSSDGFKSKLENYIDPKLDLDSDQGLNDLKSELNKPIFDDVFLKICFTDEYDSSDIDIVEHTINNWGWIRIVGRTIAGGIAMNIQVPELTRDYIKKGARALKAAYYKEKKGWDLVNDIYNVSTYTGTIYKIALGDMEKENMDALERANIATNTSAVTRKLDKGISNPYYGGVMGDSYIPSFEEFWLGN